MERILDKQYYDQEHLHKKRISGFVRDGRLLMNDIKKLVKQVSDSGLPANYQVRDAGMCLQFPNNPYKKRSNLCAKKARDPLSPSLFHVKHRQIVLVYIASPALYNK